MPFGTVETVTAGDIIIGIPYWQGGLGQIKVMDGYCFLIRFSTKYNVVSRLRPITKVEHTRSRYHVKDYKACATLV